MRGCIKLLAFLHSTLSAARSLRALNQAPHFKARYGKNNGKQCSAVRKALGLMTIWIDKCRQEFFAASGKRGRRWAQPAVLGCCDSVLADPQGFVRSGVAPDDGLCAILFAFVRIGFTSIQPQFRVFAQPSSISSLIWVARRRWQWYRCL